MMLRVVITRAREQASELAVLLREAGMEPVELPLIELRPPEEWSTVDAAISRLDSYDWVLFTSANAVRFLSMRMPAGFGFTGGVCCIGSKTKAVAEAAGWNVTLVPREYVAESVVEAFAGRELRGSRVLLPRAAVARDLVPAALRERGAVVEVVEVYRNVVPADAGAKAAAVFAERVDWVAFTSSSTVKNLLAVVTDREVLRGVRVASIGPVTTEAARKHGLEVDAEADPHTLEGLVAAMLDVARPIPTTPAADFGDPSALG